MSAAWPTRAVLGALALVWLAVTAARMTVLPPDGLRGRVLLTERMVLAARFCDPLPTNLKAGLLQLANWLETDPGRREVIAGRAISPDVLASLSEGYRAMALFQLHPDEPLEERLKVLGSEAVVRLNILTVGFGVFALAVFGSLLMGDRKPEPVLIGPGVWLGYVLGLTWAWDAASMVGSVILARIFSATAPLVVTLLALAWSYALAAALLGLAARQWRWRPHLASGWGWLGPAYLMCLFAVPLADIVTTRLTGAPPPESPLVAYLLFHATSAQFAILAVVGVLVGPMVEELIFRAWLAGGLEARLGRAGAVMVSALLFALVHGDFSHLLALLTLGAILGWTYLGSRSIWCSWGVHALWNATSMLIIFGNRP